MSSLIRIHLDPFSVLFWLSCTVSTAWLRQRSIIQPSQYLLDWLLLKKNRKTISFKIYLIGDELRCAIEQEMFEITNELKLNLPSSKFQCCFPKYFTNYGQIFTKVLQYMQNFYPFHILNMLKTTSNCHVYIH